MKTIKITFIVLIAALILTDIAVAENYIPNGPTTKRMGTGYVSESAYVDPVSAQNRRISYAPFKVIVENTTNEPYSLTSVEYVRTTNQLLVSNGGLSPSSTTKYTYDVASKTITTTVASNGFTYVNTADGWERGYATPTSTTPTYVKFVGRNGYNQRKDAIVDAVKYAKEAASNGGTVTGNVNDLNKALKILK